ncbi:MAG TPA: hypothetical protein VFV52_10255 [Bacilli bacterium]|nr:hypothetical protein [Bacilli bacterium]
MKFDLFWGEVRARVKKWFDEWIREANGIPRTADAKVASVSADGTRCEAYVNGASTTTSGLLIPRYLRPLEVGQEVVLLVRNPRDRVVLYEKEIA